MRPTSSISFRASCRIFSNLYFDTSRQVWIDTSVGYGISTRPGQHLTVDARFLTKVRSREIRFESVVFGYGMWSATDSRDKVSDGN